VRPARKRAQAIGQGRGREHRVIVPLAFETAARISARPIDRFLSDPTELANGLSELWRALGADGIVVACADGMERESSADGSLDAATMIAHGRVAASLEACARLRQSSGDEAALVAGLTGPATLARQFASDIEQAGACFAALTKAYCVAGADLVLVIEDGGLAEDEAWQAAIRTAGNIARFHQASLLGWSSTSLATPVKQPLSAPAVEGVGFILTDERVAADADIAELRGWVSAVRGS
jgi:hypothetical protein